MMQHATFSKGHASYLIGKLNWTPLPFEAKKIYNIPSKRYLHTAIIYQEKLYILGGIDNDTEFKEAKMFCLDLCMMKWTIIEGKNFCESRNSHSCALFKNQIYFFGGSRGSQQQENPTNDFFKFNPVVGAWMQIQSDENVPSQRQLAIMASINDQYMFLYGGIDIAQDKIFDDAYLFKNDKWQKLNTSNSPSERIKMGIAICGRRIFIFGGEGPSENATNFFNNLYQIVIDEYDLEMSFKQIMCKNKIPARRTAHGMVGVSDRFFLIYGGEGINDNEDQNNTQVYIFGDIWIYDIEQMQWAEIETLYGTMTPRYEFSMTIHKNQVFIFGGMNEEHSVIDDLAKLQFMEDKHEIAEVCLSCEQGYVEKVTKQAGLSYKQPQISTGFYYNMAMQIVSPFRAIQIICQIAQQMGSQSIKIYNQKADQIFQYINFQFASLNHLKSSTFLNFVENTQDNYEANIIYNLKVASLRIGRTFIYIEANQQERKVYLMSTDSRYAPNYEQSFIQYSYVENLKEFQTFYGQSYGDKQTIYNILKSQIEDPYSILSRNSGNLLAIFQINILPTVEKAYYYELIFYSKPQCDIKVYHNQKKNEVLQEIGYSISNFPDFSLRSYFKYSKLKLKSKIFINDDENEVAVQGYLDYLRKQKILGVINELVIDKFSDRSVQKCVIFECIEDNYLQNNQGILIYCGNILIDRYDCKIGQLISDKFYKKRYKKAKTNIFKYVGVLYLSSNMKLNQLKTKVRNQLKYNEIIEQLINKIKNTHQKESKEQNEFAVLYQRLIMNRENNKRLKKQ